MERYKQALEIFLKIDKTAPNGDHEVCYYIGMCERGYLLKLLKIIIKIAFFFLLLFLVVANTNNNIFLCVVRGTTVSQM